MGRTEPCDGLLRPCRSGGHGAVAVNQLAAAGSTTACNLADGVEGDLVEDPQSVHHGKRMQNGWKHSAPWDYDIDPERVILETIASEEFTSSASGDGLLDVSAASSAALVAAADETELERRPSGGLDQRPGPGVVRGRPSLRVVSSSSSSF